MIAKPARNQSLLEGSLAVIFLPSCYQYTAGVNMLYSCSSCLNWAETAASFARSFATTASKPQWQLEQARASFISKYPD